MTIEEQLLVDLKEAMLAGNSIAVSTLRMLKSELKNTQIALGKSLEDGEVIQVIRKEVKKRTDAISAFRLAGHEDRAQLEESESTVLTKYLPTQVDATLVEAYVREQIAKLPEPSAKNRGEVIKQTVGHFGDQVEGKVVSQIVSTLLP
jgi:uncharacterized protein YqeY